MALTEQTAPLTERLWTAADGTFCVLATGAAPPSYTVSLMRGAEILHERRLYGRASAQMLAIGWREVGPSRDEPWMRMACGRSRPPVR